jgi:ribosomal protein S18 acetylase RimI-like enzyme
MSHSVPGDSLPENSVPEHSVPEHPVPPHPARALPAPAYAVRDYTGADEQSWLRCRVLAFLATAYFDDVARVKPAVAAPGFELVAVDALGDVVGIMDVRVEGALATIGTVAVHPDHQHRGIGRALLAAARERLTGTAVTVLDAWTRDDPATLRWYRAAGFTESERYLHVYADLRAAPEEPDRAIGARRPGLRPVTVFLHAALDGEEELRARFARVHVCRRLTVRW